MKKYNYYKKQTIKEQQLQTQVFYKTLSKLNMRSAPTKMSNIIIVIPKDQKVLYLETIDNIWYKVKYKKYIGFCMKKFLK